MPSVTSVTRLLALVTLLTLFATPARADDPPEVVVERRQGEPVRGRLLEFDDGRFKVLVGGQVVEVDEDDVREVRFAPPRPANPRYRAIHEAPTLTAKAAPGAIDFVCELSKENAYVVTQRLELWERRAPEGEWSLLEAWEPASALAVRAWTHRPTDPWVAHEYKLVAVAAVDGDSPVVQHVGLELPEGERRKESAVVAPPAPGPAAHVLPSALLPGGGASVVVYRWVDGRWTEAPRVRVARGEQVADTGLTLEAAELRDGPDGPRLALTLKRQDGTTVVADGRDLPADLPAASRDRGLVLPGHDPGHDRDAAVRAALDDPRPVSLRFDGASLPMVAERLRQVTRVDVAWSREVREASLSLNIRSVPQREALPLAAELMQVDLVPWCGVLWLQGRDQGQRWTPPPVAGPLAEQLERTFVTLDLDLPLEDALLAVAAVTGVNVVVSPAARDTMEDKALVASLSARDLRLREAFTLLVHGAEAELRWHARGSVVLVHTLSERPTREVAVERVLEALERGRAVDGLWYVAGESDDEGRDARVQAVVSRAASARWTRDEVLARFRFEQGDDGQWSLAEPPLASGPGTLVIDDRGHRGAVVSLERLTVVPYERSVDPAIEGDLFLAPFNPTVEALVDEASTRQPALAPLPRPFDEIASVPDGLAWAARLPGKHVVAGSVFLARTKAGQVYKLRLDYVSKRSFVLTVAPLAPGRPRFMRLMIDAKAFGDYPAALVSLDDAAVLPLRGRRVPVDAADLWVEPQDPEIAALAGSFEGTDLSASRAAMTLTSGRAFGSPAPAPSESAWQRRLPREAIRTGAVFLARSRSGKLYDVRLDRVDDEAIELTFTPFEPDTRRVLLPRVDVELDAPAEGAELDREQVTVAGRVTPNAPALSIDVTVNGATAAVTSGGRFSVDVTLPAGPTTLEVVARAAMGERTVEGRAQRVVTVSPEDARLFAHEHRTGEARRARDGLEGCMPATTEAVRRALAWLLKHQAPDGRWDGDGWAQRCEGAGCKSGGHEAADARYDAGLTALALLAFTADGQTHRFGPDRRALAKAVAWLLRQQSTDGSIGVLRGRHDERIYNHALATQALCELAAMSPDDVVRTAARRAVEYCLALQTPDLGWKYGERPGRSDTSVTGVMVQALLAAKTAGFEVPDRALAGARNWFDRATDANGETGYETPGGGSAFLTPNDGKFDPVPSMTALAVACRLRMGDPRTDRTLRQGAQHLLRSLPLPAGDPRAQRQLNFIYWNYGASAAFQLGGEVWGRWSATMQPALVGRQRTDGCAAGSWDPVDEWSLAGGRVYATAINALTLQVYHRHEREE